MSKLFAYLRVYFLDTLTYRGDILLFTLSGLAQPIINIFVWLSISGTSVSPMSRIEFVQYFILVILIGTWTSAWAGQFISADIRLGKISPYLLRPVPFIFHQIANNIGEKIIKTIYLIPFAVYLINSYNFNFPINNYLNVTLFIVILGVSTFLMFIADMCIGFMAFWLDDTEAVFELFGISMFFFSGKFIPLIMMPKIIQDIANFLPFRYVLSFPIELLLGKLTLTDTLKGLAVQLIWLGIAVLIYKYCWSKGLKKYSASGA